MSEYMPVDIKTHGVILQRDVRGRAVTNVPQLVVQHSPDGFEWNYGGSGPSDLALNILEWLLQDEGYRGERQACYRGSCFTLAWDLHHNLKWDLIAHCPRDGDVIPLATLKSWLETYRLVVDPIGGMLREDRA